MDASDQQVAKDTIVRAWADEEFRASLPEELRREISARPLDGTGAVMSDQELETAAGAATPAALVALAPAAKAAGATFGTAFLKGAGTTAGAGTAGYVGGKVTGLID